MKVLLIQPQPGANSVLSKLGIPEPLALEILAATIPHHDVKIIDMRLEKQTLRNLLADFQPDVIGLGCLTAGYYECVNLLEQIKQIDPNILTVVGGHHPTVMPQDFVSAFADYIVIGEGEKTFRDLVDTLELKRDTKEVKGLAIPKNGRIHFTDERPLIDLDEMPIPRRDLTRQYRKKYFRGNVKSYACMVTSRGCQFRCKFCCQWKLNRGTYRIRQTDNVVDELLQIKENFIDFVDDNSWANANWMNELFGKIQDAGIKKEYKLYARSDLIIKKPDVIAKWKDLGLKAVLIGFESFRDEDLKKWNKRNTVANNVKATKILKGLGVEIVGYFLVDPAFEEIDFQRLVEHVQELDVDQPIFSILTPFPGTHLFDEVKDKILTSNYTFYDGMHALTPTKLDQKKFYKLYSHLFRKSYPKSKLIKKLLKGGVSVSLSQAITQTRYINRLADVSIQ
jgi:hopanoid C-3 methylase